jgi:hypothetical protein
VAVIAGIAVLRASDSVDSPLFPKCPLYWLTGWYCSGCGSTRALHALAHGDLPRALASNSLMILGIPVLAAVWSWRRVQVARGGPTTLLAAKWIWLILGVLVAYGILRNIPYYPWTLLAPH